MKSAERGSLTWLLRCIRGTQAQVSYYVQSMFSVKVSDTDSGAPVGTPAQKHKRPCVKSALLI